MLRNRLAAASCCLLAFAGTAFGQLFTNSTPITIADNQAASPYHSTITVSGFSGPLGNVDVRLNGITHTFPADLVIAVQAPTGQIVALSNRCGGAVDSVNANVSFSANAVAELSQFTSGFFQPRSCSPSSLVAPAPAGPYSIDLTDLAGINPNGIWRLWIVDAASGDIGQVSSGWSISLSAPTRTPASSSQFTYQGVASEQGAPMNGPEWVRFRLFDAATGGNRLGPSIVAQLTFDQGLFTTTLDFGAASLDPIAGRYLEVAINGVVQSPRQRVTNAPMATRAASAAQADNATRAASAAQADNATHAASASQADAATNATNAASVPWSGITGIPANVSGAFSPWTGSSSSIAFPGIVAINSGVNAQLSVGTASTIATYQSSSNQFGTWAVLHNDTAANFWQIIATGTGNGGGPNDLIITNGPAVGVTTGNLIRLNGATNSVGIGLPTGALPTQRLHVNGNVLANNVAVPSSIRFKDHVEPMNDALSKLLQLEGVRFDWKPDWAKERPGREHDIGFVAEEVEKVFPEVVFHDADGNVTGMDYSRLTAVAIEAIKQQQKNFDAQLAKRDAENAELKARLDRLEKALNR